MTHLYFHCATPDGLLVDRSGRDVTDLAEAHARAAGLILACLAKPGPEDWRAWTMCVADPDGEPLFELPFAAFLGRLH